MRNIALLFAAAVLVAGCRAKDNVNDTSAVNDTGAAATPGAVGTPSAPGGVVDTGAMSRDTGMAKRDSAAGKTTGTGGTGDTGAAAGASGGTAGTAGTPANQTQSGVTNAKTGASTLGKDVKKTRPDQGEPTTSKGDTVQPSQPPR
jgi:hypothetical protein